MSADSTQILRIAILVCDVPSEPVPSKYGDYPKLIATLLRKGHPKLLVEVDAFDCRVGQYPTDISQYNGVAITGSRHGAYDDFAWIRTLEEYLRKLDSQRVKMMGICFGHQVLAKALGGTVVKNPAGWELGVVSVPFSVEAKRYFGTDKAAFALQYIHQDHVSALPPGAKNIGGHAACAIEGFLKDDYIITFQGHPEFHTGVMTEFLNIKEEQLPHELIETAKHAVTLADDSAWFAQHLYRFFTNNKAATPVAN